MTVDTLIFMGSPQDRGSGVLSVERSSNGAGLTAPEPFRRRARWTAERQLFGRVGNGEHLHTAPVRPVAGEELSWVGR